MQFGPFEKVLAIMLITQHLNNEALPSMRGVNTVTPGVYCEEDFSLEYIVMESVFPTKHF